MRRFVRRLQRSARGRAFAANRGTGAAIRSTRPRARAWYIAGVPDVSVGSLSESAASIRHLVRTAASYGLALDEGPSAAEPAFHARVSSLHASRLWERAVRELGPELPLIVARKGPEDRISPLFFAAMSGRTVRDALHITAKHWRYVTEAIPTQLIRRGRAWHLRLDIGDAGSLGARAGAEYLLADLVRSGRELSGGAWRPTELVLGQRPSASLDDWESACGVPVRIDPESPGLMIAEDSLDIPLRSQLAPAAGRFFLELLDWATPPSRVTVTLAERVAAMLADHLGLAPSIEQVAQQLMVSTRSLHRRLVAERTSYHQLLDEVRREAAIRQIADEQRQLKAIASAVGFSDLRGFRRAFKRWTGLTPQQFRNRMDARRSSRDRSCDQRGHHALP